jgi:hypothetical protein
MACIPAYRDILIFRKRGEIVGISKVCLDCWKNQTHGTVNNRLGIDQHENYGKLQEILY